MFRFSPVFLVRLILIFAVPEISASATPGRTTQSLDGQWQVAEGNLAAPPAVFGHTVPVPGLLDMAQPPFESPGSSVVLKSRGKHSRPADPRREAFWYRRTFRLDGPLPAVALLKVNKAFYGTKVFVNGQTVGEHAPNFTPGWFDVRSFLKRDGGENELVIRVGASLAQVSPQVTDGYDFEKSRYIPGIYDSVQLILSGTPHVVNVQTVPDVDQKSVRAVIELANAGNGSATVNAQCVVREKKSRKIVGEAVAAPVVVGNGQTAKADVVVAIRKAKLWTPEAPFLYELEVDTGADTSVTRFGLRSLRFDPDTGYAYLNGKKRYLRGSNVCIYRFFEDAVREALPWDETWVRNLHRKFKEMHWESLRYCIGFPPERWYEIADEEGILIQDEFPVWSNLDKRDWQTITVANLVAEYTEWIRERWNHPCVVLWDAQNETSDDSLTAPALMAVRNLDLSRRSWDNGWGTPQRPGDTSESHPYRWGGDKGLPNFATETGVPDIGPGWGTKTNLAKPPYLINEYGWLWINRDGSLPTLTVEIYARILGTNATVEERREYYARTLAAKTEFWRGRRKCAGVLHFCGLGYSRPDGQTSDNFTDVKNLVFEPNFFRYVRDAFAPVGVMLDFWGCDAVAGEKRNLRVAAINDLDAKWKGTVRLRLLKGGSTVLAEQTQPLTIPALGEAETHFDLVLPREMADYTFEAALVKNGKPLVCSLRDVHLGLPNLALGRPAKASSEVCNEQGFFAAQLAVDGKGDTRWSSEFKDDEWLAVDLGAGQTVSEVKLFWEAAYASEYVIEISADGEQWKEVARNPHGKGGVEQLQLEPVTTRWIRMRALKRATGFGVSLWEFRVTGEAPTTSSR